MMNAPGRDERNEPGVIGMVRWAALIVAMVLGSSVYAQTKAPNQNPSPAERSAMSDAQIVQAIIGRSRAMRQIQEPCACPDDRDRDGRICGRNSAYHKHGKRAPLCFPRDVTPQMIKDFRAGKLSDF
jgi:hypothetical protein